MSEFDGDYDAQLGILADEIGRLERRLRSFSAAAWRSRVDLVRDALRELVAVEAAVRGTTPREVPVVAEYALADAWVVIAGDVSEALAHQADPSQLSIALSIVRSTLEATR